MSSTRRRGSLDVVLRHRPLQQGDVVCPSGHELLHASSDGRDDGIGQLHGRGRLEPLLHYPVQHHARLAQPRLRRDAFTERPVDGHQVPLADEQVQLEQVNVFRLAQQGRVEDDKQLAGVCVHHRDMGTFQAFLDGQGMEIETIPQHLDRSSIALRDIHPHESVRPFEQLGEVGA